MFTMFMTFFSSLWNAERDLVRGAKSGQYSTTTVAAKAMLMFVLPVILESWMRGEFDDEDKDDDEMLQGMLMSIALYPIQSIPVIRDMASAVGSDYGYNMSPIAQMLERALTSGKQAVENSLSDDDVTRAQTKAISKGVGAALGVPGVNQVWATGEHLAEVIEEGEDLTIRELIYGPKR